MKFGNSFFLVLDIETSKEMQFDEKLGKEVPVKVWLSYGVCKLVKKDGTIVRTLRFRKWDELKSFLSYVSTGSKLGTVCFVHNLAYEFDFLIKNVARPKSFLCNSTHSAISAKLEGYRIEFRCTYQLSKEPLWKIGEMYHFPKLDSEYRTIYPWDEVTDEEWEYCERDCDILIPYILDEIKKYKMLCYIPYTSTGRVRRNLKENIKKGEAEDWDLMPPEDCYEALNKTFRGAITMSNPRFTNIKIPYKIRSWDEKSKYPSAMLCYEYPYTIEKCHSYLMEDIEECKFFIAKIRMIDITSKFEWGVISTSTTEYTQYYDSDIFNGKIINCHEVIQYVTNVDIELYKKVYNIGEIEYQEFYPCRKYGRLPQCFIDLIITYAEDKVRIGKELKEIEEKFGEHSQEYIEKYKEYMEAKAKLNSIYGMMVQKLVQPEYEIDENFIWHEKPPPYKQIIGKHIKRNFLYGIYITSYSRYDLAVNIIHNCPFNFVYCDTDSIKYIDIGKEFEDLNPDIPEDLQDYKCLKGFNKFEEEEPYTEFITYGAKKYAYIRRGEFGFTVAGLPKKTDIKSFDEFTLGSTYKDCKLTKRYIVHNLIIDQDLETDDIISQTGVDSDIYDNGGIALYECDYTLNMTQSDLFYIKEHKILWQREDIQQNMYLLNRC